MEGSEEVYNYLLCAVEPLEGADADRRISRLYCRRHETTTFAVLILNMVATFCQKEDIEIFGRRLDSHAIKNAALHLLPDSLNRTKPLQFLSVFRLKSVKCILVLWIGGQSLSDILCKRTDRSVPLYLQKL